MGNDSKLGSDGHTPEQLAMARRIAAHALCGPEKWKPGVKAGIYEDIMRGDADAEAIVQGPLAAIIETNEAAAKFIAEWPDKVFDAEPALFRDGSRWTAHHVSSAIRRNSHLRPTPTKDNTE